MLLIGSRAIVLHFPEFREPLDWDLIGTDEDIAWLSQRLPVHPDSKHGDKAVFLYDGAMVEVANASRSEYWAHVLELFKDERVVEDPVLGELRLAPPGYLLLTKHCGLVYHIVHWHKNLEDLYFLRDRIPSIPEEIAELLPWTLRDSKEMFFKRHRELLVPRSCHPGSGSQHDVTLHKRLHAVLSLSGAPAVELPGAWEAFPEQPTPLRQANMQRVLAEEAMVLAAEELLRLGRDRTPAVESELTHWALRNVTTGALPLGWRYFGINYFREVQALIPAGWMGRLGEFEDSRSVYPTPCLRPAGCAVAAPALLTAAATGAARVPVVRGGGLACANDRAVGCDRAPVPVS